MFPLLEIKSVPIEIRMKVTNASLEYSRGTAEMEIRRSDKGLDIKSRPIKVNLDTFEARSSVNPTPAQSIQQAAQSGQQAAYEATASYAQHGQLMLDAKLGQEMVTQFSREPMDQQIQESGNNTQLGFAPESGVDIEWEDGQMQIRYEMDKMSFDWKIENNSFEFTPGDIEITIEQQPSMTIRYLGGPIYVPRSADPNYEPLDVEA